MTHDTYRVTISREHPWWVAVVEGIGATESHRIAELEDMIRDLVLTMRDLDDPNGFDLEWSYDLPEHVAEARTDYRRARTERDEAERRYLADAKRAAHALDDMRVSNREAAHLMGISFQRVQQLRTGSPKSTCA